MKRTTRLALERLEDRIVPSGVSTLWPNASRLTLSFVPDGTYAAAGPSNLFSALSAEASPAAWEQTILRAFQTWAVNSNVNIGLVPDDGSPLGTSGALQGDPRFGDIRIAGEPLPSAAVATTAFVEPGSTWSGDMILNTNYSFGTGAGQYDLFSVVLHEAGHDFNLPDSNDPNSVMYQAYRHYAGLTPTDEQLLQANYGAPPQPWVNGNDSSMQHAFQLQAPTGGPKSLLSAAGHIATNQEVDWYKFQTQDSSANGVTVRLHTEGLSLFVGRVNVYDAAGNLVASSAAADPLDNDVTIALGKAKAKTTYYVSVEGATDDVFGMGAYQLSVDLHGDGQSSGSPFAGAQNLQIPPPPPGSPQGTPPAGPAVAYGTIAPGSTTTVYKLQTPDHVDFSGGVNVSLQAWGVGVTAPAVTVYDKSGNVLAAQTATTAVGGSVWLHVDGVAMNSTYYIVVQDGVQNADSLGAFALTVDLHPASVAPAAAATQLLASNQRPNNTIDHATNLQTVAGFANNTKYEAIGSLAGAADADFYHVHAANFGGGQTSVLTVTVIAQDQAALAPQITVYDSHKNAVAATVLTNANGICVVQITGAASGADYFVEVTAAARAGSAGAGNYYLSVDDSVQAAVALQNAASGTLKQSAPQQSAALTVAQNELFNFVLSADVGASATPAAVRMDIYDANGKLVYSLIAYSGQPPASGMIYLGAGTYTVVFSGAAQHGAALPPLAYSLAAQVLSQPIGPQPVSPYTTAPTSPSPTGTTTITTTYTMTSPSPTPPTSGPYHY